MLLYAVGRLWVIGGLSRLMSRDSPYAMVRSILNSFRFMLVRLAST